MANICQARAWISQLISERQEIMITPLPLYHIFSLTANCFVFSSIGALNVLITNPRDLKGFIKELKKWKFTAFTGVNTLFNGLLSQNDFKTVDFSSLKLTLGGGMAVQRAVALNWKKVTGATLIEAYGLTETSPAACMNPMSLNEFNGSIGLPICSTDIRLKNDAEEDVHLGEIGEICVKGPQVMRGYWKQDDETKNVMTADGYLKTGDLGIMDAAGFIKVVDRKKDMVIVSGFKVFPTEIEEVISGHSKVFECAVVGIPDDKTGEAVKLYIVKKDPTLTSEEIIHFCSENMTNYKVPRVVEFRTELPKSNVGKILRKDLR
jgi:long-chain acyl-CoA synthetase